MAQTALKDFWEFGTDVTSVVAWVAKAAVAAPLVQIITGIGPPWPTQTAVALLTSLVEILILMYAFEFWGAMPKQRLGFRLRSSILVTVGGLILFVVLFAFFAYEAPTAPNYEVRGFLYQPRVQELLQQGTSYTEKRIIEGASYDPLRIWEHWTVYLMRVVVLMTWLLLFTGLATSIASFVLMRRRRQSRR